MPIERPVYFILGGPGSGKGTNCARLVEEFGFTHLSAGDLLRAAAKQPNEMGERIMSFMREGKIVPSEITVELLRQAIDTSPSSTGFLIDGFPRKADQAVMFEEGITRAAGIVFFQCSEATMEKRLLSRGEAGGRDDDNVETIRRRFRTNLEECMPVVEKYKQEGRCHIIDADDERDAVYAKVKELFLSFGAVEVAKAPA